jgi:sn1-specific diacylglycerol lipase
VSRLSLGSVRDIRNAALWLCDANERNGGTEGYSVITNRIRRWKAGDGSPDDHHWVRSMHHDVIILIACIHNVVSGNAENS